MNFKEFTVNSNEYQKALALRNEILRAPLKLDIQKENLNEEKEQLHYGLFDETKIHSCLCVVILSPSKTKIRQMAVNNESQGKGFGSKLLLSCLEDLKKKGYSEVELNARKTAVNFYKKYGFQICSDEFIEVTIPHFKMSKEL